MPAAKYAAVFSHRGFICLVVTQFLGGLNDNTFRMVLSLAAVDAAGPSGSAGGYLSLVGAVFILPYFLFSGYAGYLADAFSKRTVLVVTKSLEIVAMGLALVAFRSGRIEMMLSVLFLMALQSTLFSPAKYGILPEMLPPKDLSRGNGLMEMFAFLAIVLGTSVGSMMYAAWKENLDSIGVAMIAIAVAGTLASLGISTTAGGRSSVAFRLNPWSQIGSGILRLRRDRTLWMAVVGMTYFWFLGALLQMDMILFGKEILAADDFRIGLLMTFLAVGIGAGTMAAGLLSGDKVELGLVPLGAIGMALFAFLLSLAVSSYGQAVSFLALLGFSGGLFFVPLNSLLQQRSGSREKGQLIATNNFLNTGGILLASATFWAMRDLMAIHADRILWIAGLTTFAGTVYALILLPDFMIRFSLWLFTHTLYRIRIVGGERVPVRGPALLVCNHVSHVDALIVGACVQRFIRFMIYRPYYEMKPFHSLFRLMKAIPVSAAGRKEIVASIERARDELREGHVVCIFAEGAISRTGNLLPFRRGFEKIIEGLDVPVIPVYLDRLWGSVFSFKEGRFFWKRPERIPYPVTVLFGEPLPSTATADRARQAVMELGSEAVQLRRTKNDLLHVRFFRTAKRRWFSFCMADSSGRSLSYGSALAASLALARKLRRRCRGESMVGLLLPPSVGGALANVALLLAGKTPVNLNFTAGKEAMASAVEQCGIRTVLSSKTFLARAKIEALDGVLFLEDVAAKIGVLDKVFTALIAFALPSRLLARLFGSSRPDPGALATVVFSSGSTGVAKGVMLSHHNILSNVEAIAQVFWVNRKDRLMGVLPFFHSLGLSGTLWLPLVSGFGVVFHPNPADAKTIGDLVSKYAATLIISTPTFYAIYLRQCPPEQFSSLRIAVAGAEKLREPVAGAFKEKYGLDLLEGYGCTEMAPVVSVNVPDWQAGRQRQTGLKPGTAGHPIPGVAVKTIDQETGETLPPGAEGLLLVKGPNLMMGYLGNPEKTAEVLREGWYVTGDIASIDEDGFIRITDRLSRFSKIGGEMVPHLKIEEAIDRIVGDGGSVVTAVPDSRKGERLVALYRSAGIAPDELWRKLNATDLPKLWIPARETLFAVEEIPLLGSGKVDLKKAKSIAAALTGTGRLGQNPAS